MTFHCLSLTSFTESGRSNGLLEVHLASLQKTAGQLRAENAELTTAAAGGGGGGGREGGSSSREAVRRARGRMAAGVAAAERGRTEAERQLAVGGSPKRRLSLRCCAAAFRLQKATFLVVLQPFVSFRL